VSPSANTAATAGKEQVNVRLSGDARKLLTRLQRHFGVSQADVLEMLLREKGRELGYMPEKVRT
jgi:hypothetical protein